MKTPDSSASTAIQMPVVITTSVFLASSPSLMIRPFNAAMPMAQIADSSSSTCDRISWAR